MGNSWRWAFFLPNTFWGVAKLQNLGNFFLRYCWRCSKNGLFVYTPVLYTSDDLIFFPKSVQFLTGGFHRTPRWTLITLPNPLTHMLGLKPLNP